MVLMASQLRVPYSPSILQTPRASMSLKKILIEKVIKIFTTRYFVYVMFL